MRKALLLLMACFLSLTMSAKVAYLLPGSATYKGGGEFSNFDFPEAQDGHNQDPEWNAAIWFYKNYVEPNNGDFITIANFAEVCGNYDAIWIHRDLVTANPLGDANYSSIKTALQNYVKNGGNLLLTKQAASLLGSDYIGRVSTTIECSTSDYAYWDGECKWTICTDFNGSDNSGHAIYKNMMGGLGDCCGKNVEVTFIPGKKNHTDHNCGIPCGGVGCTTGFGTYQTDNACRILGTWGGDHLDFAGVIEFYPKGDWKGTILMIGIAAYQWTYNNVGNVQQGYDGAGRGHGGENVLRITQNAINYLANTPNGKDGGQTETKMSDIFLGDWCYPASLATENHSFRTIHPTVSGWTTNNWIAGDQTSVADIMYINDANKLVFKQEGTVTLHTTITEDRELQAWPKGTYEYTHDITFAFTSSAQAVVDADLSSNGLDGETGNFMLLHPNMQGMDSLGYTISFDGIGEAQPAEVVKIKDGGATRLVFTKAGTVKLNISLNEPNYREEWAKGEHNVVKTVTFAQPAFTWSHTPDEAALNEDKPAVVVTCDNVPGATVKYESSDPTIAAVDAETGKISYIKEGTTQINAYIEINGVKFVSDKKDVTVNGLNITWTTAPAETAKVGESMTIAAAPQFGSATILYETINCSYADGKLSFSHSGSATVQPYAEVNGTKYTAEMKTITVSPDLKWVEGHPMSAFVGEQDKWAKASTNEGTIVYSSSASEKVAVDANTGALTFLGYDEACVVTITATVTIDSKDYSISGTVNANLPNVMWTTEPAASAYVGQKMDIAAKLEYWEAHAVGFETSNCTYADGKLTVGEGETATVRPYVELTAANKKYYGAEKSIAITTPAVTWTQTPGNAAVLEQKPNATATCNVAGVEIRYRSLNTDVIEINAETGALTYKKPSDEEGHVPYQGVIVEAYTTVNGMEYKAEHETKVYSPKADWVTRPHATTALVGGEMAIAGRVRYGAAAFGFKTTGDECYTLSEPAYDETEKVWKSTLRFIKAGTTTIRPYAEAYGVKYYNNEDVKPEEKGEAIEITVSYAQDQPDLSMETIPTKVWDMFPVTLPATLNGLSVTYSINNERATLAERVLTYASDGEVTLTATYTESRTDAPWPAGDYEYTKTIMMAGYGEVASDADIAYLLPESLDALEAIDEKAEYNAAKWFMETYIGADKKGKFVKNLTNLTGIKTLWINVERVGITKDYAVLADNADEVEAFVKAGGNVLLTKQATRLAHTSGRMPLEPNFTAGEYFTDDGPDDGGQIRYRERSIATKMGTGADHVADQSNHQLYNLMLYWDDSKNVYMVAPNVKKTNNYCGWQDLYKNVAKDKAPNTQIACLNEFEAAWKCKVLGIKGHIVDYCFADVVDFAPQGDYKGRIIAVGSSAYQWGESNRTMGANDAKEYNNLMQFTKNAIAYLQGEELEVQTYDRKNAKVGNYSTICYPFAIQGVEGATVYDLVCMSEGQTSIILEEVTYPLTAGKSYIFLPTETTVTFSYSGGFVETTVHDNGMYGNINADPIQVAPNADNYILYNNALYFVDSDNVLLNQYRAYIKRTDVPPYKAPTSSEHAARRRTMNFVGGTNTTTALENSLIDNAQVTKRLVNGRLIIVREGKTYNVMGQQE